MENVQYKFKFVCDDFEIEVSGDQKFVEKTMARLESKVMLKLKELLPLPEATKDINKPVSGSLGESDPKVRDTSEKDKKAEHRRRRNRRSSKKHRRTSTDAHGRIKNNSSGSGVSSGKPGESGSGSGPELKSTRQALANIDPKKIRASIEENKPRTHHDRIMLFGHHLETQAGSNDFSAGEIEYIYKKANEVPPVNIQQVLNHAARSGFLTRVQQGKHTLYRLSAKAKKYVQDGLTLL